MKKGKRIGRYEIERKIGIGGMGEVFLARDTELDRNIALKVLLPEFCCDADRVQRFKLEAKAVSALNHPNIITIHEIIETGGQMFMATEFVEGETLRSKIDGEGLTVQEAVRIAEQIADALTAAHEAHLVHRDIKPENVMIRRDAYVKILDFGLAKPALYKRAGEEDKTLQIVKTQPGLVMGSVHYMSPEQARGKDVDQRTDVWSLGVVLYEMLSGGNPFEGETVSDSLAAIIHVEPPSLDNIPEVLSHALKRSLAKKPEDRYQSVRDFALDLKEIRSLIETNTAENQVYQNRISSKTSAVKKVSTDEANTVIQQKSSAESATMLHTAGWMGSRTSSGGRRTATALLPFIVIVLAGALAVGAWYNGFFSSGYKQRAFENFSVTRITGGGKGRSPAISPDGKYMAYKETEAGNQSLVVRQIATGSTMVLVPPTKHDFLSPAYSKDGSYVYYTTVDKGVGTLYQIPALGGQPKKITVDVDSKVAVSGDDKKLAFICHNPNSGEDGVYSVNVDGSNRQLLFTTRQAEASQFVDIAWSPTEDKILVAAISPFSGEDAAISQFFTLSATDKTFEKFGDKKWYNPGGLSWLKDGSGLYFTARKNKEEPQQIWYLTYPGQDASQITHDSSGYDSMTISDDGKLIAASNFDVISSIWTFKIGEKAIKQIVPENSNNTGAGGIAGLPDGRLLFTKKDGKDVNLWVMGEDGSNPTQLTFDVGVNIFPTTTPDGRFIIFTSDRAGNFNLWRMDVDGKNPVQLTRSEKVFDVWAQVLADGKTIVFGRRSDDRTGAKLMKISIEGGPEEEILGAEKSQNMSPAISSDRKKLAYLSHSFDAERLTFDEKLNIVSVNDDGSLKAEKEFNEVLGVRLLWINNDREILYQSGPGLPNLHSYSLETGSKKQLTEFASGVIMNFGLSQDRKRAFVVHGIVNSSLILIKDGEKQ